MKKILLLLVSVIVATKTFAADVGQLIIPAAPTHVISASYNDFLLDASGDSIEYMFQCEEACAIDGLCVRQGSTNLSPPTYKVSLQGVNTSGRADGTVKSSLNATGNITPPGANSVICNTLTSSYTCTKGEYLAAVLQYASGTIGGSNNASFTYSNANALSFRFPMSVTTDATGPTTTRRSGLTAFGYKCGSTYYGFLPETSGQHDFGSLASPPVRGNKFTIPASSCSTFKIDSARFNGYMNAVGSTLDLVVYEGTTVRQDTSIDTDFDTSGGSAGYLQGTFDEGYTFTCGTEYAIAVKPNSTGGTSAGLQYIVFDTAAHQNSLPLGTTMYYSGLSAGVWTDDTTKRALIDLIISDITEPSGGVTYSRGTGGNKQ